MRGRVEPRLWTPPLRELTPATSVGFSQVEFARDVLHHPFDPWQEWLVVHAGELLPDGRPRFRRVLVEVARQNGKTEILVVLTLWWQFVEGVPLILGTSTKLDYAKESWTKAVRLAESAPDLDHLHAPGRGWKRQANGEQESWTLENARYKIAASNDEGGRSLTVDRLVLDELRQHHSYDAWDASVPAGKAVRDFQVWALSNAGDDRSVVLNDMHAEAESFIESGGAEGDYRLGMFSWSCEPEADPLDVDALAQANPNLGHRMDVESLLLEAASAVAKGGKKLAGFRTENMCIRVRKMTPAIDGLAWRQGHVPGDLSAVRRRVALCLDVAPDGLHATLAAAAVIPARPRRPGDPPAVDQVRVEVVAAWTDTDALRRDLVAIVARVSPRVVGWFPSGPAASIAADLDARPSRAWPPKGVTIEGIRGDTAAVCMGLAEQVKAGRIVHNDDPLLNAHVTGAEQLKRGDRWVFARKGEGHVDAAYAAAGAVHLARLLPPPVGKPRLLVAT